jgi:hypothetical protein
MISLSMKKAIEAKGNELEAKRHEFMGEMNGRVSHMMHILNSGENKTAAKKAAHTLALEAKEQERLRAKTVQLDQIEDNEELQVSFNSVLFNRYR